MTIVWADDITGAAEIAGISLRYGLKTTLMTSIASVTFPTDTDTIVIATNIRSASRNDAEKQSSEICETISRLLKDTTTKRSARVFIKTDSVLRGHIQIELATAMNTFRSDCSLLIAQNPSKGRIIKGSTYFIGEKELHETLFNKDPEFPATTSSPTALVGGNCKMLPVDEDICKGNNTINIGEATSIEDIKKQIAKIGENVLMAGGADFFETYLQQAYPQLCRLKSDACPTSIPKSASDKVLVVSGSTQGKSISDTPMMRKLGAKDVTIPDDIFEGEDPTKWIMEICEHYKAYNAMIMRIGEHEFKGVEYAQRLKSVMAKATKCFVEAKAPSLLIIEGGATAYAILECLRWSTFVVTQEFTPGVVSMQHDDTTIILKPGSYSWGELFDE